MEPESIPLPRVSDREAPGLAGPVPASAARTVLGQQPPPALVESVTVREPGGRLVQRFAVCFAGDAPIPAEYSTGQTYERALERGAPLVERGIAAAGFAVIGLGVAAAVAGGVLIWGGIALAALAAAVLGFAARPSHTARYVPSEAGRIVILDELPAEAVMSRFQRFTRWLGDLPGTVLGIPVTAAVMGAGAFGIVGARWVLGSAALFVACVMYTIAGLETDDEADGVVQALRRPRLRSWLRLGANSIFSAVGIAVPFLWFDELGRDLPPWAAGVVFGLLGFKALYDHFRGETGEPVPKSAASRGPVAPRERAPLLKPLARAGCVAVSLPVLGKALSLASPLLSRPALVGVLLLLGAGVMLLLAGVTGLPRTRATSRPGDTQDGLQRDESHDA